MGIFTIGFYLRRKVTSSYQQNIPHPTSTVSYITPYIEEIAWCVANTRIPVEFYLFYPETEKNEKHWIISAEQSAILYWADLFQLHSINSSLIIFGFRLYYVSLQFIVHACENMLQGTCPCKQSPRVHSSSDCAGTTSVKILPYFSLVFQNCN